MLTNLANYLNNDFPFHMFFTVQILLAEGLFVVRMKSRLRPLKIVLPVVLCYLVLAWFHPLLGHRFARVAAIFVESLLVLCLTMDIPTTNALCIGISSYAIQLADWQHAGWPSRVIRCSICSPAHRSWWCTPCVT